MLDTHIYGICPFCNEFIMMDDDVWMRGSILGNFVFYHYKCGMEVEHQVSQNEVAELEWLHYHQGS